MSYILEALRKAERERTLGQAPDLNAVAITPLPRRSIWPWLAGIAVAVNAAALVVVLGLRWRTEHPPKSALAAPKAVQAEPAPRPAPLPQSDPKPLTTAGPPAHVRNSDKPRQTPVASAPLLQSLPAEFRRSLPELNLDVHVYNQKPAKRFVMINSRRYREGDSLREGPLLETITLDGAVLSHRGRRFRILLHR